MSESFTLSVDTSVAGFWPRQSLASLQRQFY